MVTWFDKKLCDAGFYINLDHRTDRKLLCENELKKSGFNGVERISGIKVEVDGFKEMGCTETHLEIAKKQIENNWDYVLYMEDDIESVYHYSYMIDQNNVDKIKVAYKIIEDFNEYKPDVLWLGVRLEGNCEKISDVLLKPSKTSMSHAYVGSLKFAKYMVDHLRTREDGFFSRKWPIDFFISQTEIKTDWTIKAYESKDFLTNDIKIMVACPLIFTQRESYSDLTNRDTDYSLWVNQSFEEFANFNKFNITPILK